ncbi:hypothetical protein QWJ06_04365 [Kocuria rhizophila]|uniref:hypothetical protein n=1 Tax=Kocuria TaxID=57493 RepID=UPI001145C40E|nr:hypothetical protein [Kocuria rhizophila]WIW67562.1 hypothetical protein P8S73_07655 [Kocuria sp. ChxB]MDA4827521.1 hypothetical protein [Kocuria rhizophila]MDN3225948.1 hypothetical protein [Kocuria rhizophila]QTK31520.1 hypothetical protein J5U48_11320 [Kocuria rhizophila]WSQ06148.1 hypothetical protein OG312_05605 [Kocuria rhizophila]
MDTTNLISLAALAIACAAFLIAIADWLQLGREAPWEATWGEEGILVLTRRHYWPVWIEGFLNFHGGGVSVVNDAAFPVTLMGRNSTVVLRMGAGGRGSALDVFYRRATVWELTKKRLGHLHHNPHWSFTTMSTEKLSWSTPVLFSGI